MKRTKKTHALGIVAALIFVLMPTISQAQEAENDSLRHNALDKVIDFAETVLDVLTIDHSSWSLAIYPAASYSGRQDAPTAKPDLAQADNNNAIRLDLDQGHVGIAMRCRHIPKEWTNNSGQSRILQTAG